MSQKKTNVLLIISDQQRYDTIGAAGFPYMVTPNLDRLAAEGCLFQNAYSTNPVCMPARHDLLMGMPSKAHGFFANCSGRTICDYNVPTFPRIFSENGYRTAAIGKMHFSPPRMHHGYSELHLMEELPSCRQDDAYASFLKDNGQEQVENLHGVRPYLYHEPQRAQMPDDLYETKWVSRRTIEWLKQNGDHPFMLYVGYIKPHPPWDVPNKFAGMYKERPIPQAVPVSREYPYDPEQNAWYGDADTPEHKRKIRESYYSCVSAVDESVGEILDYLREQGTLDDTLVIFTSDHGEMLQDKGFYSKELPYEGAVHIPMIMRYPKEFQAGSQDQRLVDLTDIFPTCLDTAGLSYPEGPYHLYGASLTESRKQEDKDRTCVISSSGFLNDRRFVMCRDKQYKYVYNYNQGKEELYDLNADPGEMHNLAGDADHADKQAFLRAQVLQYETKWGPEGAVCDGALTVIPGQMFTGSEKGKYHLWCNHQFQNFTELQGEERMAEFDRELEKAMTEKLVIPDEIPWQQEFEKGRKEYFENKPMDV